MPYFVAENIKKDFENCHIDFSFSAEKATMTCIVGASGSGKSTVLRCIAGLEKAENNQHIELDGCDITKLSPGKRNIGLVAQNHALFSHMTVADNVAYGLVCRGMNKRKARKQAEEYLCHFNLSGFGKRFPETLSGGESQRVALARTLIIQPKLVLFDEPLSALDAPLRKKLAKDIRDLQKEIGFTAIMVTHDIAEAKSVADKIILMSKGKKTWEGKSSDFDENMM